MRTTTAMRSYVWIVTALWLAVSPGCSHGAHAEGGGRYRTAHTEFRVGELGNGWQRHDSDADVAFYHQQLNAMILANSDCGARDDAPLKVAANSLLIGFTEREVIGEERIDLAGREALHRRLRAKLDGVPLAIDSFVLKKDGCIYDLVYLSPPDAASRGAADFARFVQGFAAGDGLRTAARPKGVQ